MRKPIGKKMTVSLLAAGAVALGGAGTALAQSSGSPTDTQEEKQSHQVGNTSPQAGTKLSGPIGIKKLPGGSLAITKLDRDDVESGTDAKPAKPMKGTSTKDLDRDEDSVTPRAAETTAESR